ncbi:MAG: aspartate aminotransferase family protein [Dethiobacter sp.]|jgi:4-aminobutyrate--pyruvate transaminase|nr:aspartate aminotransferase family protein [Dethiobacter sp.]MBS4023992.1 aspartate aminotransferase family protein [Dethiobacter sp.]
MSNRNLSLSELDSAHLLHPITEFRTHEKKGPRIFTGGQGIRLETSDGKTVIDGFSGLFNINIGHGRTEVADAVAEQMRKLAFYPSFYGFSSEPAIKLAERMASLVPDGSDISHFLFTTGGSDANETIFRTARLYHAVLGEPQRMKILSRRWSYHGITRAAGSATTLPVYHVFSPPDPLHIYVAAPYCFRCEFDCVLTDCNYKCIDAVEEAIHKEGAETIAAFVAEPVAGTGGIIPPPPEYFSRLEKLCKSHGILLILDEVITGFGRTGKWFGMEHWNIYPDLMSFAKGITSGYLPLGGMGITRHVYETIRDKSPDKFPFMAGLTYNNHPASCAAALVNIDIIQNEGLVENARETGAYLLECMNQAFGSHPFVADIRGLGMLASIECAQPGTKKPVGGRQMSFTNAVSSLCWEEGLIIRSLWENISLAPPLCTTRTEIDEIVCILQKAVDSITRRFA